MLPVSLTLGDWLVIDAVMDETRWRAVQDVEPVVVDRATAVREAGWAVTAPMLDATPWPPDDEAQAQVVTIRLPRAEWAFVLDEVGREPTDPPDVADRLAAALAEADPTT